MKQVKIGSTTFQLTPELDEEIVQAAERILTSRAASKRSGAMQMSNPEVAGRLLRTKLANLDREHFMVLFLDTRHRLIASEDLFQGTIDGCEVHPRVVVQRALTHNASAIILGHNHPSGDPEPSAADRAVTQRLKQALALVDIRLLDHFVIGDATPVSLAARGWV